MCERFHALSVGQGQAPIATRMIKECVKEVDITLLSILVNNASIQIKCPYYFL